MKRCLSLVSITLLGLTSCGTLNQLRCLVEDSSDAIYCNRMAVECSTQVICENAQVVRASTEAVKQNGEQLKAMHD